MPCRRPVPRPPLAALAICAAIALPAAAAAGDRFAGFDDTVARAMAGWQVPGLAVAAVADGRVVLRRTYGVRDVASGAPVTPRTVFALGSITKSLTGIALALAAAEGTLGLDAPVRRLLPGYPPDVTPRHLLSHTAGWPRHDALWYLDVYGRAELARRLARLPRFAPAGAAYQYNNVPFAAAGQALEVAAGESWEAWVRRRLLVPAGMGAAGLTTAALRGHPERATPYFPGADGRVSLPFRDTDPVAPAAGLSGSLETMLPYLDLLARDGLVAGNRGKAVRVVPAAVVRGIRRPAAAAAAGSSRHPEMTATGYGLGLNLVRYRGHEAAYHPGVVDGYGAFLAVVPGRQAAVLVMTNLSGRTPVARVVAWTALDRLLGAGETDWLARYGHRRGPAAPEAAPPPPVAPDRPLAAYAGTFEHPAYGRIVLTPGADGTRLAARFHRLSFALAYAGGDRWRLDETQWPLRAGLVFRFADLAGGRFGSVAAALADGPTYRHRAGPLSFARTVLPRAR